MEIGYTHEEARYVCMYVCMYASVHICMLYEFMKTEYRDEEPLYVCMYVFLHVCMYLWYML